MQRTLVAGFLRQQANGGFALAEDIAEKAVNDRSCLQPRRIRLRVRLLVKQSDRFRGVAKFAFALLQAGTLLRQQGTMALQRRINRYWAIL